MTADDHPAVHALHVSDEHTFSKRAVDSAELLAGIGVIGDAHAGPTVKHRWRVRADPTQPNLRQVHLIPAELFDELAAHGYDVGPGDLGENITTKGIDLHQLSTGAIVRVGSEVILALTGLRNPCGQIENFMPGLLGRVLYRDDHLGTVRRAGVMAVVINGGSVRVGDPIAVCSPPGPAIALRRV